MRCVNWEVGSTWYTYPSLPIYPDNISGISNARYPDYTLLSTCRSAIGLVLNKLKDVRRAIVPSFTCHSVIEPFIERGISVKGFPIGHNLMVDWAQLISLAEEFKPQMVLIHGYFGFDTTADSYRYIAELKRKGIIIVEDRTQTMFSNFNHIYSDFRLGSIRKWMPIPDGAYLRGLGKEIFEEDTELSDAKWKAMTAKGECIYNGTGEKNVFTSYFKEAEELLDSRKKPYAMAKLSLALASRIKYPEFTTSRRENYKYLASHLNTLDWMTVIFPELPDNVVPFMLPVFVPEQRGGFQKYMAQHNVYPTIIWKCPEEFEGHIDTASRSIYDKILCFHIDQRYDLDDMRQVAGIASKFKSIYGE